MERKQEIKPRTPLDQDVLLRHMIQQKPSTKLRPFVEDNPKCDIFLI